MKFVALGREWDTDPIMEHPLTHLIGMAGAFFLLLGFFIGLHEWRTDRNERFCWDRGMEYAYSGQCKVGGKRIQIEKIKYLEEKGQ